VRKSRVLDESSTVRQAFIFPEFDVFMLKELVYNIVNREGAPLLSA